MCAPDAPDTSGQQEAARESARLAREQWELYRTEVFPRVLAEMERQGEVGERLGLAAERQQDYNLEQQKRFNDRFWGTQVPLEDQIIADAREYDTEAKQERLATQAMADVAAGFENQRGIAERGMTRMGVNPNSGRFAQLRLQMDNAEALGRAAGATAARDRAEAVADAKMKEAAALGRGLPGFGSTAAQIAQGWGGQGMNTMGMSGATAAGGSLGSAASTSGQLWNTSGNIYANIANTQVQAEANNPMNTILGAAAGAGTRFGLGKMFP